MSTRSKSFKDALGAHRKKVEEKIEKGGDGVEVIIEERSDIDEHAAGGIKGKDLGEYLGDGFFLNEEFVQIYRDEKGRIARTVPLSDGQHEDMMGRSEEFKKNELPPMQAEIKPMGIPASDEHKVAYTLAHKLYRWYESLPPAPNRFNPVHDGIPICPDHYHGCPFSCKSTLQKAVRTSATETLAYLVKVIGARVEVKRRGGHITNITLKGTSGKL